MADFGDSAAADLFFTDTVLPAQFWERSGHPAHPERRLLAAVLEDAVALWVRGAATGNRELAKEAADAGEWMASDERSGPFSFVTICDVLDLDPDSVRAAMTRLRNARAGFVRPRVSAGRGRHQINRKRRRSHEAA